MIIFNLLNDPVEKESDRQIDKERKKERNKKEEPDTCSYR